LIINRDGIVGRWFPPEGAPKALTPGKATNLKFWGPDERASIFHSELLSKLDFAADEKSACVSVRHLEIKSDKADNRTPQMEYRSIVEIVRPTEVIFRKQLDYLDQYADLRADRASEILTQLGVPAPFFSSIAFLHPLRTPWTLELLFVALRLAYFVVMWAKHGLACRRPHEYSPQVQPIIEVPLHGTLPSGHATEGFMFALVFWKVLQAGGRPPYDHVSLVKQLMSQAARIAINRTVAGVHFPVDSAAGAVLGLTLGNYFVSRCGGPVDADYQSWKFDGSAYPAVQDFYWDDYFDANTGRQAAGPAAMPEASQAVGSSEILNWLWRKAVKEWMPPEEAINLEA
jgi:PAP2 superfamily